MLVVFILLTSIYYIYPLIYKNTDNKVHIKKSRYRATDESKHNKIVKKNDYKINKDYTIENDIDLIDSETEDYLNQNLSSTEPIPDEEMEKYEVEILKKFHKIQNKENIIYPIENLNEVEINHTKISNHDLPMSESISISDDELEKIEEGMGVLMNMDSSSLPLEDRILNY